MNKIGEKAVIVVSLVEGHNATKEACKLIESGFEFVTNLDGFKLFRKRK